MTVEGPNEGEFRWTVLLDAPRTEIDLAGALASALESTHDDSVQLWIREVDDVADSAARRAGFRAYRDLWQLRCPLPNEASRLVTRAFTADDIDEFVLVNNRAFHWHPEQGALTAESVRATMAEPWFDADGFRLFHEDGSLVGFCWTKIHADHEPPLGEIYVIAIDPSRHGRGLGKPMTLAGLEWLHAAGMRHGMLYVESDNGPANATYEALGFTRHHTDRAYRLDR
jgi:mycothiol synthase